MSPAVLGGGPGDHGENRIGRPGLDMLTVLIRRFQHCRVVHRCIVPCRFGQGERRIALGVEPGDEVGAVLVIGDALEHHLVPGCVALGVGDVEAQLLEGPGSAQAGDDIGIVEGVPGSPRGADHTVEIGALSIPAARLDAVATLALAELLFAVGQIRTGQQGGDRHHDSRNLDCRCLVDHFGVSHHVIGVLRRRMLHGRAVEGVGQFADAKREQEADQQAGGNLVELQSIHAHRPRKRVVPVEGRVPKVRRGGD